MKKLYRIEVHEERTPVNQNDEELGMSDLVFTGTAYYEIEVWTDKYHYDHSETFPTLREAVKFMKEE